jgi:polyhydroxyalkanoate synthesis regulator phasin
MLEDIKKGLMAGFGTIFLTKDKIEEATKKLADQAKISREDAQKLADELVQVGEERWGELEKAVTEMTRKGMDSLDLPRQSELADLKKKIEKLEKRLATIEAQGAGADK